MLGYFPTSVELSRLDPRKRLPLLLTYDCVCIFNRLRISCFDTNRFSVQYQELDTINCCPTLSSISLATARP